MGSVKKITDWGGFRPLPSSLTLFLVRLILAIERRIFLLLMTLRRKRSWGSNWNWPDGFYTPHNQALFEKESFRSSYAQAVATVGADYEVPWRIHQAIWGATTALSKEGAFVEFGTGKGFVMAAVLHSLGNRINEVGEVLLLDVFQKPEISGRGNQAFSGYYAESSAAVRQKFSRYKNVRIIEGDIRQTVVALAGKKLSFVHMDLNDAPLEAEVLEHISPDLVEGAVIIMDDFGNAGLEDGRRLLESALGKLGQTVLSTAAGQGIVIWHRRESS